MSTWPPLTHQDVQDAVTARAVIADVATAGTPTGDALRATYGRLFQLAAYDDLTARPDGALTGSTQVGGLSWSTTGTSAPAISGGRLNSASTGYAYLQLPMQAKAIACGVEFTNPGSDAPMTMAWVVGSSWDLTNLIGHFNFGSQGFFLTLKSGSTFYTLLEANWKRPLQAGRAHTASVSIIGDSFVVQCGGEVFASPPDPRTRALAGSYVFWEPSTVGGDAAEVSWVAAFTAPDHLIPGLGDVTAGIAKFDSGHDRQAVGNQFELSQAIVGMTSGGQPGIRFGASRVVTSLSLAASSGATSIKTAQPIPPGSTVVIDEAGTAMETVTANSTYPPEASPPYTTGLTGATTQAHAAGVVAIATVPTGVQAEMYLHQGNGFWYMPNVGVVVFPGNNVYLGNDLGQALTKASSGVIATFGGGSGKGAFRAGDGWATGSRPLASDAGQGSQGYDTTLHIPIWSDGTNWRNAAGTIV